MPLSAAARERLFFRATANLREAEALASIQGVEGPADALPQTTAAEPSWIDDWSSRAGRALGRAVQFAKDKRAAVKERARSIINRVTESARAVQRAASTGSQKVQDVISTAQRISIGFELGMVVLTGLLLLAAYKAFVR